MMETTPPETTPSEPSRSGPVKLIRGVIDRLVSLDRYAIGKIAGGVLSELAIPDARGWAGDLESYGTEVADVLLTSEGELRDPYVPVLQEFYRVSIVRDNPVGASNLLIELAAIEHFIKRALRADRTNPAQG